MKLFKKFKRRSLYQKSLIIFSLILIVFCSSFLVYVWSSMVIYERNLVDNYIKYLADYGKLTESIDNNLFEISKYEKKNVIIKDGVKEILKSDDLTIKKNTKLSNGETFAYDLKINDRLISTVSLKSKNTYTRMAILNVDEWEVENIETYFDNGIYNYEISVPNGYKVYINNYELSSDDISYESDVADLERLTKYIEIQKKTIYEVNNLVYEPEIKIVDENKKSVDFKIDNSKIVIEKDFKKVAKFEDAKEYLKEEFDVLALAENWSLFLTDDLGGSYHGFFKLTPYLIKDSYMYEMAYGWSHNVDITFVSSHRLKNPVFTNEEVKNCIIYNTNAFSCEVTLEKNMVVSGKSKVDVMHDRMYFIYYEGGYKLVDMQSIES